MSRQTRKLMRLRRMWRYRAFNAAMQLVACPVGNEPEREKRIRCMSRAYGRVEIYFGRRARRVLLAIQKQALDGMGFTTGAAA